MSAEAQHVATARVFLCTFRRNGLLPRSLKSLLGQTFRDWACELHNDAPDDSYPARVAAELADPRISVVNHTKNLGAAGTLNLMFDSRPERYVSLLEDDNWWEPRFLERMVAEMDARPEIAVGWSNMRVWTEQPAGSWTDTGRTVWSRPGNAPVELLHWPRFEQSWRAFHSNGAMLVRTGNLAGLKVPPGTRFDFVEPVRERAMAHPLLFVPEPLANFSQTLRTARTRRRDGLPEHNTLLLASFFRHVRPDEAMVRAIWSETRRSAVRSTDNLILAGLYASECRRLLPHATAREWGRFLLAQVRRPRLFVNAMRARERYPELWNFLDRHTRDRSAATPSRAPPPRQSARESS